MRILYREPLDRVVIDWWRGIDTIVKKAFFLVIGVNLLAFGFEMTNLTLHHDDLAQILIQDTILGHYVGRFGLGWLNYFAQNAYFMPFLQMLEGIVFMSIYGILVARFWGARRMLDIVLIASIICVFPFMAQLNQYNTAMATYSLAHLLAAVAVMLSTRGSFFYISIASVFYIAAFSIYQSVIANAATIFVFWAISSLLFKKEDQAFFSKAFIRSTLAALLSVAVGGLIYLAVVSSMDLQFDSYQSAGQAFSVKEGFNISYAVSEIIHGTRSFFFWPEHYFPNYLKKLQMVFLVCAGLFCLWLPKSIGGKIGAVTLLALASLAPRLLQLLHPEGVYHNLTLTAYALVIAGSVMIINRPGVIVIRNLSIVLCFFLIGGYVLQCNWISTVNSLNTLAHYTTMTQVLSRIRSLPDTNWDGKKIVVVGNYNMPSDYPYKSAVGVATEYIDAIHMQHMANLMRDDVTFFEANSTMPEVMKYAATHTPWPHPDSVAVINGTGVVVFSNENGKSK